MADCAIVKKNIGPTSCKDLPQLLRGMITTGRNFSFSAADSEDSTKWQDALLADPDVRIHKWPDFRLFENQSEETIYEDTPLSTIKVRDGKMSYRVMFVDSLCNYNNMISHNDNGNTRVFFVDSENKIYGTVDADGNFKGFLVAMLNVEKLILNDGSAATKIPVKITMTNPKELMGNGANVDGAFFDDLVELIDVEMAVVGSITTGAVSFTVTTRCDGVSVSGLVVGDFSYKKDSDGSTVAITSLTELDGVYTAHQSGALLVDGKLHLADPADLSIKLYEATGPLAVNVP